MRRFTALFLALILILALIPPVEAAEADDLRAIITKQYDAYAASLNQPNAHENAISRLLNHAISGRGKKLTLSEKDPVTASIFNSNLFRDFMISALISGSDAAVRQQTERVLVGSGSVGWRDYALFYTVNQYKYTETPDSKSVYSISSPVPETHCSRSANQHDKALILVVGGVNCFVRMVRTSGDFENLTYRVSVTINDYFDFEGDYTKAQNQGYNTELEELICFVGKMLDFGLFEEYNWTASASFDLTVPNTCAHQSGNYRWEDVGHHLVNVSGEGLSDNPLKCIQTKKSDGSLKDPYYLTAYPVILRHDLPWVVEFRMSGSKIFVMSPTTSHAKPGLPFLLKSYNHVVGGVGEPATYISSKTGKEVKGYLRNQYGVKMSDYGIKYKEMHTYRIENRIAADGSNMAWLLIDGVEIAPMNQHYENLTGTTVDGKGTSDWFNGTDFCINYIFNASNGYAEKCSVEYVQIWENGEGREFFNCITEKTVQPTCESAGYTERSCKLCNVTGRVNMTPEKGHDYKLTGEAEPGCESEGSKTYTCESCGDSYTDKIDATGHDHKLTDETKPGCETEGGKTYTCESCGDSYTDKTDATGHSYTDNITPPTCTDDGYTEHQCTICGHSYQDAKVPATGHTPGNETEENRVEPTAAEEGGYDLVTRCEKCDEELQRTHHVLEATGPVGDASGDGKMDNIDAMMVLQHFVGLIQLSEPSRCDVNHSGSVDNIDAMLILQFYVGLIDTFPTV